MVVSWWILAFLHSALYPNSIARSICVRRMLRVHQTLRLHMLHNNIMSKSDTNTTGKENHLK